VGLRRARFTVTFGECVYLYNVVDHPCVIEGDVVIKVRVEGFGSRTTTTEVRSDGYTVVRETRLGRAMGSFIIDGYALPGSDFSAGTVTLARETLT
jgi:hypothetical protein